MKNFAILFFIIFFFVLSCAKKAQQSENVQEKSSFDGNIQTAEESALHIDDEANQSSHSDYLDKTKGTVVEKDSRKITNKKTDASPLHHARVDSALILNRYENKHFIKNKIEQIAKQVVQKPEKKKSIAEQMGESGSKKISISIDENVSIKDAIMEVSLLAGVDVEVDPDVSGGVILSLKNAKVADVLERITELAELNVSVKNNVVRFMANKPFTRNYSIAFVDANIASGGSVSSVGSNSAVNNNVGGNVGSNVGGVGNIMNGMGVNMVNTQNSLYSASNSLNSGNSMWEQFENGLKYIVSQKKGTEYSINKQAGVITLRAPISVHNEVEEYIEKIKKVATAQILVEVRLVEVALEDEFSSGIDFNYNSNNFNGSGNFLASTVSSFKNSPFAATVNPLKTGSGLKAAVNFLQTFGTTKTISSPRLNVMNNQKARLSFAQDYVYFSLQPQIQNQFITAANVTNPSTPIIVQSIMQTVPIGVILNLQATADTETNEITMNIHPVLSAVTGTVDDPAASFLSSIDNITGGTKITNSVPIVKKKELDSTLRIKSGDIMVIGGFNEERTSVVRKGIPKLKDMPVLRYVFGSDQQYVQNVETVIFIKATIINSENPISQQDVKFYNDFA
jgi:type II secretory pathway component GspD/PulD (secretin)